MLGRNLGAGGLALGFHTQPLSRRIPLGEISAFPLKPELSCPFPFIKTVVSATRRVPPVTHEFRGNTHISSAAVAFPCRHPDILIGS